ncbi:hypothetical protein SAMN04488570_1499 [Nocardioides scoriae]|uniref:Uncharacterized protein n=1 Tax=Nocardioides scoriae TaxID=642780 RepID=A0A1H1QTE7_9ACTN|nr:hypothetical protein [Nocardioides scoriae]SDS26748.1 hypothetical protein SAMN04488570_1499 [Nocardioides scoriae]
MHRVLRRLARPAVPLAAVLLLVTACGSPDGSGTTDDAASSPSPSASASASASPSASAGSAESSPSASTEAGTVIDIRFADGQVTPAGKQVEVGVGEPFTLRVEADAPGELHIHSTPEQELAYEAGTTEKTLTLDRPGVVDIESHTLDQLVVRVEVS